MPRFHVTYDHVTPESAERGDYADIGYIGRDHIPYSTLGLSGAPSETLKIAMGMGLRRAVQLFGERYGSALDVSGDSFTQSDAHVIDYASGREERLTLHAPENATRSSLARLERLLRGH